MIKIERIARPEKLTEDVVRVLTEKYRQTKRAVWNKDYIKEKLLEMTHHKCCYCETSLDVSGNYMEVEHFYPKSCFPDRVVDWANLLPSCKRCNIKKGDINPEKISLINPTINDPKQHFKLDRFRIKGIDEVGKNTIKSLNLNDLEKLMLVRMKIAEALINKIEDINDLLEDTGVKQNTMKCLQIRNSIHDILEAVQPNKNYSATLSSILLHDENYNNIKQWLQEEQLWDNELDNMDAVANDIALKI